MKTEDDKLYGDIFGADEEEAPAPQATPSGKAKTAIPRGEVPPPVEEIIPAAPLGQVDPNEAARLFQEMMADSRKAAAAAKKAEPAPVAPEPVMLRAVVVSTEDKPKTQFADSLAPWTLFKGASVLAMLIYIVGFHGRLLNDAWPALVVTTVATSGAVLIFDFLRASLQNSAEKPKKKTR